MNHIIANKVYNGHGLYRDIDPYNPLNLPANTIRVKFKSGYTPTMGDTQTLVDSTNNIWDIYKQGNNIAYLFNECYDLLEVLGANTSNVTNMSHMFTYCTALSSLKLFDTSTVTNMSYMFYVCSTLNNLPLFDTSNVTDMNGAFNRCGALTYIPLFNTSKVCGMGNTFWDCKNVQSGALALYQQASSQAKPPVNHGNTFLNCGINTETGSAELSQIPTSWGGTME